MTPEFFLAIKRKLTTSLEIATDENTWFDDQEIPLGNDPPIYQHSFVIVPGNWSFDPDWGGNPCSLMVNGTFSLSYLHQNQQGEAKKLNAILLTGSSPMFETLKKIISAILIERQEDGTAVPWRPVDQFGQQLFDIIKPTQGSQPSRMRDWPHLYSVQRFTYTMQYKV